MHFEMEMRENLARRMTEGEARAATRRHFGSVALVCDRAMDSGIFRSWDSLLQDVRYAARTLRRSPAFTVVSLLSLDVGFGAGTAIFSLMNVLFLEETGGTRTGPSAAGVAAPQFGRPAKNFI